MHFINEFNKCNYSLNVVNEKNTTYEMILLIAIDKYKVSKEHFFSFASLDHKYGPAHH